LAGAQISTSVTILNSLKGFIGLSLTNFSSTAISQIAAGSVVEVAGAYFNFVSNDTINASSWTAITTATTAYLALTPSGTAGSQILTSSYIAEPPVWHTSNQGYYASATSNIRIVGSILKIGATSQGSKLIEGRSPSWQANATVENILVNTITATSLTITSTYTILNNLYVNKSCVILPIVNSSSITTAVSTLGYIRAEKCLPNTTSISSIRSIESNLFYSIDASARTITTSFVYLTPGYYKIYAYALTGTSITLSYNLSFYCTHVENTIYGDNAFFIS
jgi:hypothetical protein